MCKRTKQPQHLQPLNSQSNNSLTLSKNKFEGEPTWNEEARLLSLYPSTAPFVIGIDEAGRGCIAGPVVTCALSMDTHWLQSIGWSEPNVRPEELPAAPWVLRIRDSKKIPEPEREKLREAIETSPLLFALGVATPQEVDDLNVLQATMLAMTRACDALKQKARDTLLECRVLVDGNRVPRLLAQHASPLVQGDSKSLAIAAASIIAKTERDRMMRRLHEAYPNYGFSVHKGYPTQAHRESLLKYGLTPEHRVTFRGVVGSA